MFLIVCVTFLKGASFSGLFKSLLYSKDGVLYCLRHFKIAREVFLIVCATFLKGAWFPGLFTSLLYNEGGVLYCLCHF